MSGIDGRGESCSCDRDVESSELLNGALSDEADPGMLMQLQLPGLAFRRGLSVQVAAPN
jgi:hypothetical protein